MEAAAASKVLMGTIEAIRFVMATIKDVKDRRGLLSDLQKYICHFALAMQAIESSGHNPARDQIYLHVNDRLRSVHDRLRKIADRSKVGVLLNAKDDKDEVRQLGTDLDRYATLLVVASQGSATGKSPVVPTAAPPVARAELGALRGVSLAAAHGNAGEATVMLQRLEANVAAAERSPQDVSAARAVARREVAEGNPGLCAQLSQMSVAFDGMAKRVIDEVKVSRDENRDLHARLIAEQRQGFAEIRNALSAGRQDATVTLRMGRTQKLSEEEQLERLLDKVRKSRVPTDCPVTMQRFTATGGAAPRRLPCRASHVVSTTALAVELAKAATHSKAAGCPVCGEDIKGEGRGAGQYPLDQAAVVRAELVRNNAQSRVAEPRSIPAHELGPQEGEVLGHGNEGLLYRARWACPGAPPPGPLVAIKQIMIDTPEVRALVDEGLSVHQLAAWATPTVVRLHGICVDDTPHGSRLRVAMELCESSLKGLVAREGRRALAAGAPPGRVLPDGEVARIGAEAAGGLAELHDRVRIWHLDVSPGNVLFNAAGAVRLADFGISKQASLAATSILVASAAARGFAAPEQEHSKASAKCDVFGLGRCLIYAATGTIKPAATAWGTVAQELRALVESMTAAAPTARPQMREVAHALRSIAAARGATAPSQAYFPGLARAATAPPSAFDAVRHAHSFNHRSNGAARAPHGHAPPPGPLVGQQSAPPWMRMQLNSIPAPLARPSPGLQQAAATPVDTGAPKSSPFASAPSGEGTGGSSRAPNVHLQRASTMGNSQMPSQMSATNSEDVSWSSLQGRPGPSPAAHADLPGSPAPSPGHGGQPGPALGRYLPHLADAKAFVSTSEVEVTPAALTGPLPSGQAATLLSDIASMPRLTSLSIADVPLSLPAVSALVNRILSPAAAALCANLRELMLIGAKLQTPETHALCQALPRLSALTVLDLSRNRISADALALVLPSAGPLVALGVADSGWAARDMHNVALALVHLSALRVLDVSGNNIGDTGGGALAAAACALPHLQELNVSRCGLGKVGAVDEVASACAVAGAQAPGGFTALHLAENPMHEPGLKALGEVLPKLRHLRHLDLAGSIAPAKVKASNVLGAGKAALQSLSAGGGIRGAFQLRPEALSAFARAVVSAPKLRALLLSGNLLTEAQLVVLTGGLRGACLTRLDLGCSAATLDDAWILPLAALPLLRRLDLSGLGTPDAMPAAFRELTALEDLRLDTCGLEDHHAAVLAQCLEGMHKLRELSVERNYIGVAGLHHLAYYGTQLTALTECRLSGCPIAPAQFEPFRTNTSGRFTQ